VDSQRFRAGYLNEQERQKLRAAANQMVEAPLFIDDNCGANLMDMHAKLRKLKQTQGSIGWWWVDYLAAHEYPGAHRNRNQEVSQLSRGLKLMSKELGCPFLVLSQLSRATENAAGRSPSAVERLARIGARSSRMPMFVGFIFRPEVYQRDREDLKGLAELILAKQA